MGELREKLAKMPPHECSIMKCSITAEQCKEWQTDITKLCPAEVNDILQAVLDHANRNSISIIIDYQFLPNPYPEGSVYFGAMEQFIQEHSDAGYVKVRPIQLGDL